MPRSATRVLVTAAFGATLLFIAAPARAQVVGGVVRDPDETPRNLRSSGEIGVMFGIVPGVAGDFANPGVQLTPGLSLALGHSVRWHLTFAYSRLAISGSSSVAVNGFDLRPATIGFPIHLPVGKSIGFAIEPLVDLIGMQAYFGSGGAAYIFSSGVGVQAVLNFQSVYLSVAPLNLQFQYLATTSGSGSASGGGFGLNMPVRFSTGLRF